MYAEHLARVEHYLPDIAGSAAQIARHAAVPLTVRLDYLAARADAMVAVGFQPFEERFVRAIVARSRVWDHMRPLTNG